MRLPLPTGGTMEGSAMEPLASTLHSGASHGGRDIEPPESTDSGNQDFFSFLEGASCRAFAKKAANESENIATLDPRIPPHSPTPLPPLHSPETTLPPGSKVAASCRETQSEPGLWGFRQSSRW